MFKKIEIWILYLVMLMGIPFVIFFGILVKGGMEGNSRFGVFGKGALFISNLPQKLLSINEILNDAERQVIDRYPGSKGFLGTPNKEEKYLLLSRFDGDLKEGIVELINLTNFQVIHTWNPDIDYLNNLVSPEKGFINQKRDNKNSRAVMKHPKLTKDGGLLFINGTLSKIDSCSNIIFQKTNDIYHHSIETDNEENIWVSTNKYPQTLPSNIVGRSLPPLAGGDGYVEDMILKMDKNGQIKYEKSLSNIFVENNLGYLLFSLSNYQSDPTHLNDIEPVNFDSEFWKKGDVFLSVRNQSMIILFRPSENKIIWKATGPFGHQHDVDILDNHRIAIFNNNSIFSKDRQTILGNSEVIIYDFQNDQYSGYLSDKLVKNNVKTVTQGRSQILPNGDLFIEETEGARTLYFNSDGSLRWAHINRANNGNNYLVSWSRILYDVSDLKKVRNFLNSRQTCNS